MFGQMEPAQAESTAEASDEASDELITFETMASQTSVWPGDRFHYTITLTAPQDVKIALEDFDEQNVSFEPFILDRKTQSEKPLEDQVQYEIDYLLSNYEIGDKQMEIPALIFRYEKQGPGDANEPSTDEMQIPALPISVRSTLNQPVQESWIREALSGDEGSSRGWIVIMAGLAGLVVSSLPLGAWAWKQIPNWQARRHQLNRKQFLDKCLGSIRQMERADINNGDTIKDQYEILQRLTLDYISYFWEVQAEGLTSNELSKHLEESEAPPGDSTALAGVLEHGHSCLYGPETKGWEDTFRQDLTEVKRLCG
jgi:hypothetical protein